MKRTLFLSLVIVVVSAGIVSAGGKQETAGTGTAATTVIYGQSTAITQLDPAYGAYQGYPAGYEAAYSIFDGLVQFDDQMRIHPALATSWEVSSDGTIWTFHLRQGVKFQDGTPFNADAVKVNFERGMDAKRTTTNRPLWAPWTGVKVINDSTIELITKAPYAYALNMLAHGAGLMLSPASIQKYDDHPGHNPTGTGPYKVESFQVGQQLALVPNTGYWGGKPLWGKIEFRYIPDAATRVNALLSGQVNVIDAVPPQDAKTLASNPNIDLLTTPGLRPYQLNFNLSRPIFQDPRVRQALNYAVDKAAIAKGIFFGYAKPMDSPLAFNTTGHASVGSYAFDPAKAKQLLSEAGWQLQNGVLMKDGNPFKISVITPSGLFPQDIQVVEAVAQELGQVGVQVSIDKVEPAAFWGYVTAPLAKVQWDMALFAFNPSNASGIYHLQSMFLSNPDPQGNPVAWNMMRYNNPKVDSLINQASQTVDLAKQDQLVGEAQKLIWDDAPSIWLVVPEYISAKAKSLTGVQLWPVGFTVLRAVSGS